MKEQREFRQHLQDAQSLLDSIELFHNPNQDEEEPESAPTSPPFKVNFSAEHFWPQKQFVLREELIVFVETFYLAVGSLPVQSDFLSKFPAETLPQDVDEWKELLISLQQPLVARGIPPYETPLEYLEPNFVLAVTLILDAQDKQSIAGKLKKAGLTTRQWQAMLKKKQHMEYYRKLVEDAFDLPTQMETKVSLRTLIANGDLQAIKYYNELRAIYRPQQSNQELVHVLHVVMEILAKIVSPEQLSMVATEFQKANIMGAIDANSS